MRRSITWAAALAATMTLGAAHRAAAQNPLTRPKGLAQKAVDATNRQLANEQRVEEQGGRSAAATGASTKTASTKTASTNGASTKGATTKTATTKTAAASVEAASRGKGGKAQGTALDVAKSESAAPPVTLTREEFAYDAEGRRDPFVSLLNTSELRPGLTDLRLTGILYDPSGRHSVATLRDLGTNALYRAMIGTTLGRMHVSGIHVKSVVFTIDEFGTTRQDSLVLGDTTRGRPR